MMVDLMTILYAKRTGHVVGGITRTAAGNEKIAVEKIAGVGISSLYILDPKPEGNAAAKVAVNEIINAIGPPGNNAAQAADNIANKAAEMVSEAANKVSSAAPGDAAELEIDFAAIVATSAFVSAAAARAAAVTGATFDDVKNAIKAAVDPALGQQSGYGKVDVRFSKDELGIAIVGLDMDVLLRPYEYYLAKTEEGIDEVYNLKSQPSSPAIAGVSLSAEEVEVVLTAEVERNTKVSVQIVKNSDRQEVKSEILKNSTNKKTVNIPIQPLLAGTYHVVAFVEGLSARYDLKTVP
jgi:hypothetical protein